MAMQKNQLTEQNQDKQTDVQEVIAALNTLARHGVLLGGRPPNRTVSQIRASENGVLYILYSDSKSSAPSITAPKGGKYYRKFVVDLSRL